MRRPPNLLAGPMGLEPTASGVTGRRYNQLNYDPVITLLFFSFFFHITEHQH
jgi:hypothetical protein